MMLAGLSRLARPRRRALHVCVTALALAALPPAMVAVGEQSPSRASALQGFPDLVGGLKATPGCLGVETAQTGSGKQVIFAWFRDKKSVLRWYYSDMHRGVQNRFFPNRQARKPLEHVPDDVGPVLAIASITLADSSRFAATTLPVSQIAIELYKPLPGGLYLGGKFAPDSLVVPDMLDVTPNATR